MRFQLGWALAAAALLGGCQASQGNSSGGANAAAANTGGNLATVNRSDPAAVRSAMISHCEQRVRSNPKAPATIDAAAACTCAYDGSLANRPDVASYVETEEGARAFGTSLSTCLAQQAGAAGTQPAEAAEETPSDAADAEGEDQ
jgi:hypothetical protein